MDMNVDLSWEDIFIRLILTTIAAAALGINRGARGQAAGFRTTILVGLAACIAMIQANLLLSVTGKTASSFATMDVMRLSLGILTGMGFIGGGCILKKGELVLGVTTAATLWIMTVIGLCFGGGQLSLGVISSVLTLFVLWILKWVDLRIPRNHRARVLILADDNMSISHLNEVITPFGYHAYFFQQTSDGKQKQMEFEIEWMKSERDVTPFNLLKLLEKHYTIKSFELTTKKTEHGT